MYAYHRDLSPFVEEVQAQLRTELPRTHKMASETSEIRIRRLRVDLRRRA